MLSKSLLNREIGVAPFNRRNTNWIIAAASAAAGLASSLFGASKAAKARREAQRLQEKRERQEQAWYDRRYNEDYLDTAAGQNLMRQANDYADKVWRKAEGAKAVGGATDAATAQAKESANRMVGNAVANIAANDTQRKDNVDSQHQRNLQQFNEQEQARLEQKAGDITAASQNASNAMMSMGAALEGGHTASAKTNPALQGASVEANPDGTTKYTSPGGTVVNGSAKYNGAPTRTDLKGNDNALGADVNDPSVQDRWYNLINA